MADLNATFVQEIFNITERERKPTIKHHSQADDISERRIYNYVQHSLMT